MRDFLRWKSLYPEPVQPPKNFDITIQDKRFQDRVVNVSAPGTKGRFHLEATHTFPWKEREKRTFLFHSLVLFSFSLFLRHLMKKHEDGSGGE